MVEHAAVNRTVVGSSPTVGANIMYDHILYNRERRQRIRRERHVFALEVLGGCCVDCGESDPAVLIFHHRGEKANTLASTMTRGKAEFEAELMRCVLMCANCHQREHRQAEVLVGAH